MRAAARGEDGDDMDIGYLLALQGFREATGNALDGFFLAVSEMGMPTFGLILAAVWYWCVSKRDGLYVLMCFQISTLCNSLLKTVFCVYRPWVRSAEVTPVPEALTGATGYSFPSGHTANSLSTFGALGFAYRKRCAALFAVSVAVVLLVGFSRNYLGVHTPQDVAVSLLLGALILWGSGRALQWEEAAPGRDRLLALGGLLFGAGLLALALLRRYPMDYDETGALLVDPARMTKDTFATVGSAFGFFTGWFWEKRRIRFTVDGAIWLRALRAAAGIGVLLALSTAGKDGLVALFGVQWGHFVASFVVIFCLTGLYPWLFQRVNRALGKTGRGSNGGLHGERASRGSV